MVNAFRMCLFRNFVVARAFSGGYPSLEPVMECNMDRRRCLVRWSSERSRRVSAAVSRQRDVLCDCPRSMGLSCGFPRVLHRRLQSELRFARDCRRGRSRILPELRRDYPLNLSISVSGGKETNKDSVSNGE